MLIATLFFGIGLGLSLGHAIWSPPGTIRIAATPETSRASSEETPVSESRPATKSSRTADTPTQGPASPGGALRKDDYWAGRHLIVTVNGQWLAEAAKQVLADVRPGAVLLTESNLGSRAQTFTLVREIKRATGIGEGLGDLPLIAVQQEGGPFNQLAVDNAPSAQVVGQSGDTELARTLGRTYAEACVGRGIAVAFAPVLDVFEVGAINPGYAARSFGTDQALVAEMGLAMADGLRQGGVLPVVKHFPGFGAATYGADGLLVVLNKDYSGLARVMFPFNEAARYGVPGMLVGHVAVPALDPDNPRRSAALSPVLVNDLLRGRWGFEGVIVADDVAFNSMTRTIGAEAAAVQALAAGCDAVLVLDADPGRIRGIALAISKAVSEGTLSSATLEKNVARLNRWQDAIGNLNPIAPAEAEAEERTAERPSLVPAQPEPQQLAAALPDAAALETPAPAVAAPEASATSTVGDATARTPTSPENSTPELPAAPAAATVIDVVAQPSTDDRGVEEGSNRTSATETTTTVENPGGTQESAVIDTPAVDDAAANATADESSEQPRQTETEPKPAGDAPEATPEPDRVAAAGSPLPTTPQPPLPTGNADAEKTETVEVDGAKTDVTPPAVPPSPAEQEPPAPIQNAEPTAQREPGESERSSVVHLVKEGESLSQIAELYGVPVVELVQWNSLESAQIQAGAKLLVYLPGADSAVSGAPVQTAAPKTESPPQPEPEPLESVVAPAGKLVHTVIEGDSLSSVAGKYEVSMTDVALWNGLEDAALKPGQLLTIFLDPSAATPAPAASPKPTEAATAEAPDELEVESGATGASSRPAHYEPKASTIDYVVQPGDTLMKISREFKTTVDALISLNELKDANQIVVGRKLKVPAPD
jgi:beta-N-acetylhexosaminidase